MGYSASCSPSSPRSFTTALVGGSPRAVRQRSNPCLRDGVPSSFGRLDDETAPVRATRIGDYRTLPTTGVANTAFLLVYYVALSVAPVALIVPLAQTSLLFVLALSVVFLRRLERVTPG